MAPRTRSVTSAVLFLAATFLATSGEAQTPVAAPLLTAPGAQPRPAMTVVVVEPGGGRSVYEVSEERSRRLPQWDQHATPEPPLSMRAATQVAEAWLISRNREIRAFEAANLMLLRITPAAAPDGVCRRVECWYYRLAFDPVVGGRRLSGGGAFTVIVLMDGTVVEPRIEPAPSTGPAQGQSSATGAGPASVNRVNSDGVMSPRLVREVKPQYTPRAKKAKIEGTVLLEGVVRPDGTVSDVRVVRSLDTVYGLDQEAIKAFKQTRFSPGTRSGQPVPVLVTFEMTFNLK